VGEIIGSHYYQWSYGRKVSRFGENTYMIRNTLIVGQIINILSFKKHEKKMLIWKDEV